MEKRKIEIIGRGNVAWHLAKALGGRHDLRCVDSRTLDGMRRDADLYLICVSDDAIERVTARIAECLPSSSYAIIAHTSGTLSIGRHGAQCRGMRHGVFYPLQTFTKGKELDYSTVTVFAEGSDQDVTRELIEYAHAFTEKASELDSDGRLDLHIGAVTACNFANHLWTLADEYLESRGIEFETLKPLIEETSRKMIRTRHPGTVQTGPAERGDDDTIRKHLARLRGKGNLEDIYKIFTRSISDHKSPSRKKC